MSLLPTQAVLFARVVIALVALVVIVFGPTASHVISGLTPGMSR